MNVVHVITTMSRGGAENHLLELASRQRLQGYKVTVVYLKGDGYWRRELERQEIEVIDLKLTRYGQWGPIQLLKSAIARLRPDIIHAHMPPAELYCRLALLGNSRTKLVISKHNDETFFRGKGHRQVAKWVNRRAAVIIAISRAVARYHSGYLDRRESEITVIHYGLDTGPYDNLPADQCHNVRRQWGVGPDELLFGTVARLVPQKALHVLIAAFARYLSSHGVGAKLAIVGQGPLEIQLKAEAQRLGIGSSVIFAGFREDIPAVMRTFDAFVLTSRYEGFGLVLLEAMAASRAILATRVSAIPEIIVDGRTGILTDVDSIEGIAEGLRELSDPDRRDSLGSRAREHVVSVFPVAEMVRKTSSVYQKTLNLVERLS